MRLTLPPLGAQVLQGGFSLMLRHRLHCTIVRGPRHCGGGDDDNGSENLVPDIGPEAHEVRGSHHLRFCILFPKGTHPNHVVGLLQSASRM